MATLIDTSVWVRHFRNPSRNVARVLEDLAWSGEAAICGQIWVEFVGGYKMTARRNAIEKHLDDFLWIDTPPASYRLAAEWLATHQEIGSGDAIIAASAYLAGASLLTLDKGFASLAKEGLLLHAIPTDV